MVFRRNFVVGEVGLMLGMLCQAQPGTVTSQVLKDLRADRWQVRRDAFERLAAVPDGVRQPAVQTLLIQLRERENAATNPVSGSDTDIFEDDDYLAYDEQLTPLVEQIAEKTNNPRAWKALVNSRYNGDFVYGNWIAAHRETLPFLLEQLHSPIGPRDACMRST